MSAGLEGIVLKLCPYGYLQVGKREQEVGRGR